MAYEWHKEELLMSMPVSHFHCTQCDFKESALVLWGDLRYILPDSTEFRLDRTGGWCHSCGSVRPIEDFSRKEDVGEKIGALLAELATLDEFGFYGLVSVVTGERRRTRRRLQRDLEKAWAKSRFLETAKRSPRCLECGSQHVESIVIPEIPLDGTKSCDAFAHPQCGGYIFRRQDESGLRLQMSFTPIYYNLEGYSLSKSKAVVARSNGNKGREKERSFEGACDSRHTEPSPTEESIECPKCSGVMPRYARFCSNCGLRTPPQRREQGEVLQEPIQNERNLPLKYVHENAGINVHKYHVIAKMINNCAHSAADQFARSLRKSSTHQLIHFFHDMFMVQCLSPYFERLSQDKDIASAIFDGVHFEFYGDAYPEVVTSILHLWAEKPECFLATIIDAPGDSGKMARLALIAAHCIDPEWTLGTSQPLVLQELLRLIEQKQDDLSASINEML